MAKAATQPQLFSFEDYRAYLKAWYHYTKQAQRGFSYRRFSQAAGFQTSNFLMLVIQGKRNLTEQSLAKVVRGLKLNRQEQEFFRNLVFFNQAKTHGEKDRYYQNLLRSRKYRELKPIERDKYEYYSEWYHPVVRELVCSPGFDGTPEWLAERLYPKISVAQCAKSMELLKHLGFISINGSKRWQQTSPFVSTGPKLQSLVVHNYHKALLNLAKEAMDAFPAAERDTSALTLGIKKDQVPELFAKIMKFRREVLNMVATTTESEEVLQLNIQCFPVTKNSLPGKKRGQTS